MRHDITPLRAAVLISKELTKAVDDASRECLVGLLNTICRSMRQSNMPDAKGDISKLARRILKALGEQRLNGRNLARLCGLQYSGRFRGELANLTKNGMIEKIGPIYVRKTTVANLQTSPMTNNTKGS